MRSSDPATRDWFIDGRQGTLFARSWGWAADSGPAPIVLFHDSLGCVDLWRGFPAQLALATDSPVLAYDRLGFGRSSPYPGALRSGFIADEAEAALPLLRAAMGFAHFVACGHSVGGGMAVECAARYPEDCRAVITMGAQSFVEERTLDGIRQAKQAFFANDGLPKLARYHGEKARWVFDTWTETWLDPRFAGWTLDAALDRVRCPVLAIHGALDEYGSEEQARRIAATRGRAEVLPGVGHIPHREAEALVVDLIRRFLE